MKIVRPAVAGTLESSDAMVTLTPRERGVTVEIESVVLRQFGAQIERAVREVLDELCVEGAHVRVQDRGAVECALRARVETAALRAAALKAEAVDAP